ncbi:unnamed protein product, partial [Prorocentrum cordatum]
DCRGQNTCDALCTGDQSQVQRCPELPECPTVLDQCNGKGGSGPVNCSFGDWSEWSPPSDCSGLCARTRAIQTPNRCGGFPCEGALEERASAARTRACPTPRRTDCVVGDWGSWGECGETKEFQRERHREIVEPAARGGADCSGQILETEVCGNGTKESLDCLVSSWMAWTPCTRKCGGGERQRQRTILRHSENGGRPCSASLSEMEPCSTQACSGVKEAANCTLAEWSEWGRCSAEFRQRTRSRRVATPAVGDGLPCEGHLSQTEGCEPEVDTSSDDCRLPRAANIPRRTCGGGQTIRQRLVEKPAAERGKPCVGGLLEIPPDGNRETTSCNQQPCELGSVPCRVSQWSEWSTCSATCGTGGRQEPRSLSPDPLGRPPVGRGGLGCNLSLAEDRGCGDALPPCPAADCAWGGWSPWSLCTATCGGGQRSRAREEATVGGKPCAKPHHSAVIEACGTGPCEAAGRSRTGPCLRRASRPHCGSRRELFTEGRGAAGGRRQKYSRAVVTNCTDGEWADWGPWSKCAKSCRGGYRSRAREVATEASECGEPATGPASEFESCNGDVRCVGDVDCELSDWGAWGECVGDASCHGTRKRSREIKVHREGDGAFCGRGASEPSEALEQVAPCVPDGLSYCEDLVEADCEFDDWSEWYQCPVSCGGGQTVRTRQIVRPLSPPAPDARRLGQGRGGQGGDWTALPGGRGCNGTTRTTKACNEQPCGERVDCKYGDWSDWGNCSQCGGQRFRHRTIAQAPANGGAECQLEHTYETGKCPRSCEDDAGKQYFCVWSDWEEWGSCTKTCGAGFRPRRKWLNLTDVKPKDPLAVASFKKECTGSLIDLDECKGNPDCESTCSPQHCILGDWSEWSEPGCDGICTRSRDIATQNNQCGRPCEGTLTETRPCDSTCQSRDCVLSEWSGWGECPSGVGQKFNYRAILTAPTLEGKGCKGALNLTGSCQTGPHATVHCEFSTWEDWSGCDRACGGGQSARKRHVASKAENGGMACAGGLAEVRPCGRGACAAGEVTREAEAGGRPCKGMLRETRTCSDTSRNCLFSTWSTWSFCSASCGGGMHSRSRSIEVHARGDGLQCDGALMETGRCGMASCSNDTSRDCKLGHWSEWGECSRTCGEGSKVRVRNITEPATEGTAGCRGDLQQAAPCQGPPCEKAVDCKWGVWSEWSDCARVAGTLGFTLGERSAAAATGAKGCACVSPLAGDGQSASSSSSYSSSSM